MKPSTTTGSPSREHSSTAPAMAPSSSPPTQRRHASAGLMGPLAAVVWGVGSEVMVGLVVGGCASMVVRLAASASATADCLASRPASSTPGRGVGGRCVERGE